MKYALILAGGKSSRMGVDKTLLPYKNYASLTHFLFDKLNLIFEDVKIGAKSDKFSPNLPVLKDEFDDFMPLKVIANLDKHFDEPVFIIAADTPFVKAGTIKTLFDNLNGGEISLPSDGEFVHRLCGFYSPKASQKARNLIAGGDFALRSLNQICATKITKFDKKEQFLNINTPSDYELIK
ncbi:molybdenum cofactor guanylyltransferase protein A [Campylobacter iguaniorum]|uniref:molybdenum cofactor guanylyltransferase n=1 Tax=Campylobacter iguaniorum TaxID=1244531 RepID=UPI0007C90EBF|nr:molybdenum cofactor guanylyltransferase [Campylobacter iguaniorum]ANE35248.1 molybdenum cofactor guanylyltransferase protein A [Campylobacter iguaniorum]